MQAKQIHPVVANKAQEKNALAGKIKNYLLHCKILAERSQHPIYRTSARLNAMDRLWASLYPMVKNPELHTFQSICSITVQHRLFMEQILPLNNNSSNRSSCNTLEEIISKCKLILNK